MTGSFLTLSVEEWKQKAEAGLPPTTDEVERNAAITARYVGWYLREPTLFKWAGMAAFASRQVGVAIELDAVSGGLFPDLDIVRETNNLVYADIAWAHLAYEHGGAAAIESACAVSATRRNGGTDGDDDGKPTDYGLLRKGFGIIDKARERHKANDAATGVRLAWEGNLLLLRHEQYETVQPQFKRLSLPFSWALSLATSLEFHAQDHHHLWERRSWFTWYMWTVGLGVLIWTTSFPHIVDFRHRWFWISTRLIPMWRRVDATNLWLDREVRQVAQHPAVKARRDTPDTRPTPAPDDLPPPPPSS